MNNPIQIIFNSKNIFRNKKGDFSIIVKIAITLAVGFLFLWLVIKMIGKFV